MGDSNESQYCEKKNSNLERICSVSISLASPDMIRSWSSGEVTQEDAFDVSIRPKDGEFKPKQLAKDGLLCERIFGPVISFRCACGNYRGGKRAREREGTVCERCGVVVAHRSVRRQRMGHIELAAPVVHPFFFHGTPSILADLLSATVDSKITSALLKQIIFRERSFVIGEFNGEKNCEALTGAEGIRTLLEKLSELDLRSLLEEAFKKAISNQRIETLSTLIQFVGKLENEKQNVRPEWLVLDVIPVVPPVSRRTTLVEGLDGRGEERIEVGDLNRLYSRVIRTNNALKVLLSEKVPEELVRRRKRSLQRAVNALFENEAVPYPVKTMDGRVLVSLLGLLKGKTGRFRKSLLGKRVDYSGRAVIVVNPKLNISQCGLPKKIAWELYRPFVLRRLTSFGLDDPLRLLRENEELAMENLTLVMAQHPVILNRAPTLHRMNVQSFFPVLVHGNAIELHPLICRAFNADFDGDQMAVHLPLSIEAQVEAKTRLGTCENLLSPANGEVVFRPSQDIVLGLYYLTMDSRKGEKSKGVFACFDEVEYRRETRSLNVHDVIEFRLPSNREVRTAPGNGKGRPRTTLRISTTVGRVLFNRALGDGMPYYNLSLTAKVLEEILKDCFALLGRTETVRLTEYFTALGFSEATRSGLSLGIDDLLIPEGKASIVERSHEKARRLYESRRKGELSVSDSKSKLVDNWNKATEEVAQAVIESLRNERRSDGSVNGTLVMIESGARGSMAQLKQLSGMRGLMARANGEVVESPITSNFREGLSLSEFFVSTHGARKSFVDVGLKTAEGGYLTRRLVHAASPVVVTMNDCGTKKGIIKHRGEPGTFSDAILGRVSLEAVRRKGAVLIEKHGLVTTAIAHDIGRSARKKLRIRSPLTCEALSGVCALCYGADLSTQRLVELGTAVGVIAAQSIGEPGTQLTMQTKHTGGIAGKDMTGGLKRVEELVEARCSRLRKLFESNDVKKVWEYLLCELKTPYYAQGVATDDKHFEIVISQMIGKIRVDEKGDTQLTPGVLIGRRELVLANAALPKGKRKASGKDQLLGITQVAVSGASFLAAASFREPKQVLRRAALCGREDKLLGITENVLVGGLIPVGSGYGATEKGVDVRGTEKKASVSPERTVTARKLQVTFLDPKEASPEEMDDELETLVTNLDGGLGDKKAWDRIVELAWDKLFEAIHRTDKLQQHVARRLASSVFKKIMQGKRQFASGKAFWAFLWKQRKWQVDNYKDREKERPRKDRMRLRKLIELDEQQVELEKEAKIARELLENIREEAKLTDYEKDVFDLAWGERLSDADIARQLMKTSGAIRRIKTYIKKKLRDTPTVKELLEA